MALKFKGKVWVFGDNLDVDYEIVPFRKFDAGLIKLEDVGNWCMANVDPDFAKESEEGRYHGCRHQYGLRPRPFPGQSGHQTMRHILRYRGILRP